MNFALFSTFVFSFLFLISVQAQAKSMIKVKAIGSSPKGQFVAFEEFGYLNGAKASFSLIRVKNVWKDRYVDRPIKVVSEEEEMELEQVRARALRMAKDRLKEFNIST